MTRWEPSYLAVYASGELQRRVEYARSLLEKPCRVCPRTCPVDRLADQFGLCKVGRYAYVASYFPHFGEEDCLRGWNGSGTIFFSGCNLRCVFCLTPETWVWTEAGPQSLEELFGAGDHEVSVNGGRVRLLRDVRVFTREGRLARVTKAFCHPYRGELVVIKPYGLPALRLTPEHPVFVAHRPGDLVRKVPAAEVGAGHWVFVPVAAPGSDPPILDARVVLAGRGGWLSPRPRRVPLAELESLARAAARRELTTAQVAARLGYHPAYVRSLLPRVRRGEVSEGGQAPNDLVVVQGGRVRFRTEKGPGVPERIPLDEALARLLGFYCAEGHVASAANRPNSHVLVFSFGKNEEALAEETAGLIRQVLGVGARQVVRRTTRTVEVGSASVALLFKALAGAHAREKRVPASLFGAPPGVVRAFLEAYWAGDGTRHGPYRVANTVSRELALGLAALLLRLGIFPYFYATPRLAYQTIEGRVVRQRETLFYVKCRWDEPPEAARGRRAYCRAEGGFWVRVRRVEREPYAGPVYNLEVDDPDHSYLAHGVAVGNCQNYDISWQLQGERVTPRRLAQIMLHLQAWGCHNINWVTPEHVVPQILEALPLAIEGGLRLPIVYNTSAYDSLDSLRLMEGIVDIYMPDFKFWNPQRARRYSKTPDYPEVARRTIKEMHRQVGDLVLDELGLARRGLILRHLVMPGMLEETEAILRWVAEELGPNTYVNVMAQYYPAGRVPEHYPEINRHLYREEFERALEIAERLGLKRLDVRSRAEVRRLRPAPAGV